MATLLAFMAQRCPRCHWGFKTSTLNLLPLQDMHVACWVCHQHFESEPGFYWVVLYISYAFSVAVVVAVGIATYVLGHAPTPGCTWSTWR